MTQSGLTADFSKILLTVDGFTFDAIDNAGIVLTWNGDQNTIINGADDINMFVRVGNTSALISVNLMMASDVIDYASAWLLVNNTRTLTISDSGGTTFLTSSSRPRQQPNATWNNSHNARTLDIHCTNLAGPVGSVKT